AVASQNNRTLDGAPSGRGMIAPRRFAPVAEFNPMPSLRAKHGKVQAQNPVILWLANNGKQSDGRHKYGGRAERTGRTKGSRTLSKPLAPSLRTRVLSQPSYGPRLNGVYQLSRSRMLQHCKPSLADEFP